MRIRCSKRTEHGVTLVDVIMAIALLGVMAGGVLGCFRYGLFVMQLARENQRATQILLAKIETIRLYNWDQVTSNGFIPTTFTDVYDPQTTNTAQQGATYSGTMAISNFPFASSCAANLRQLTVTLNWTTRSVPHTRSVTTFIAKDGMQPYVY
jgi:type II secretory pathway pseudopilin PulG